MNVINALMIGFVIGVIFSPLVLMLFRFGYRQLRENIKALIGKHE